ncbi:kinase-like domain-containing protein [Mycena latifolia]|nr:kinase-like domain-containing protein [Mycena latifolia]
MTAVFEGPRINSPAVWDGLQYSDVSDVSPIVQSILHVGPWLEIHKNLVFYALDVLRRSNGLMTEIRDLSKQWAEWDILSSLGNYQSVVNILLGYLNNKTSSKAGRPVQKQISEQLSQDVSVVERQLVSLLRDEGTYRRLLACRGSLAQQLLDLIQNILDSTCDLTSRPLLSKALIRLSRASELHPTCFALSGLEKVGQQVAAGGFGDICKGLVGGQSVAVKIMRLFRDADVKAALKDFGREALIWRQLSHPNLLPFFGLYYLDNRLCLVSLWMENGDILEFLRIAPADTDRPSLILDVAMGLEYLHGAHIIHGDLKASNILVTPLRRACIADFGLSSIADSMTICFTHSTAGPQRGTMRWQAPELLRGESGSNVRSDVYAFACVCYEIFSEKIPFYEVPEHAVMFKVAIEGLRPAQPVPWPETTAYHNIWELMHECWNAPGLRPAAAEIVQRLVGPLIGAKSTHSGIDWDEMSSSRFRRSLQDWPLLPWVAEQSPPPLQPLPQGDPRDLPARNGSLTSLSLESTPSSPLSPDQSTASSPTVSVALPPAAPKQRRGLFKFATMFKKSAESSPMPTEEVSPMPTEEGNKEGIAGKVPRTNTGARATYMTSNVCYGYCISSAS